MLNKKYDPFQTFNVFSQHWEGLLNSTNEPEMIKVIWKENEEVLIGYFEVPGVKRENLTLQIDGKVLSLKAVRNGTTKGANYTLPAHQANAVTAKLEDGVLEVRILKMKQKSPVVTIKID